MKKIAVCILLFVAVFVLSTEVYASPKAAVLIDGKNKRIYFEINKDEKLPMASTTKIMTALLTLEEESLDDFFIVDSEAIKVEGSSMGLKEGDFVTLRGLAAGMLLSSGNDAANAAAVKIAGSIEEFVALMNKRAREMGLENTSFATPSGLDGKNHYSTAYDMAVLASNALDNPDFAAVCGAERLSAEYGNPPYRRTLVNHNRLIKSLYGATGVKTGFTKKAGRCLVSSVERDGVFLICVTLGCSDDWNYHTKLYEEYFASLENTYLSKLVEKADVPVIGGTEAKINAVCSVALASLFDGEYERITVVISKEPFLFAPVKKGEIIGKAKFYLDGKLIEEAVLTAEKDIDIKEENESFFDKIKDIF